MENIDAFVEKYIYEYRGFLFRIHTWRQIEILSVWFAGILAALGASVLYFYSGFSESVYQYIAAGIAEVVLLSVVMRLSDEPYKVNAVKMYMIDYLKRSKDVYDRLPRKYMHVPPETAKCKREGIYRCNICGRKCEKYTER